MSLVIALGCGRTERHVLGAPAAPTLAPTALELPPSPAADDAPAQHWHVESDTPLDPATPSEPPPKHAASDESADSPAPTSPTPVGSPASVNSSAPKPHPLADVDDAELERRLLNTPASLGPISLGRPNSGALFNAVPMPKGPLWRVVNPRETWGTQETVDALIRCIERVAETFPDTPPLHIGDISIKRGGHLRPHSSHQSGRDVDLGFYYETQRAWYTKATTKNLDKARTWALIRAMITDTDVQAIFIDRSVQRMLRAHAEQIGEDAGWLDDIFGGPMATRRPLITHEPGHKTHIHVRFYNPIAQHTGRRVYRLLLKHQKIRPPTYYVKYKAKRGDTLGRIARKFKTTVKAIKRVNRIRKNRIYRGRTYRIPRRGGVRMMTRPEVIPPRRLPPPAAASAPTDAVSADAVSADANAKQRQSEMGR